MIGLFLLCIAFYKIGFGYIPANSIDIRYLLEATIFEFIFEYTIYKSLKKGE